MNIYEYVMLAAGGLALITGLMGIAMWFHDTFNDWMNT